MTARSHRINPADRDQLHRRAALALHETSPTCNGLAKGLRVRRETASRWRNGAPSPIGRFLKITYMLASNPATTPWPLLAQATITALEGRMESMEKGAIVRRYWQLKTEAAEAQTARAKAEAMAAETGNLEPLEAAETEVAAVAQESAAITRLLRKYEIDPRDPQWR